MGNEFLPEGQSLAVTVLFALQEFNGVGGTEGPARTALSLILGGTHARILGVINLHEIFEI